jgi:hypothetical protein
MEVSIANTEFNQEVTKACPEKSDASFEEMEAMDLEANPEAMDNTVKRQELYIKEANVDTTGSLEK